jgi:hypothetical protein
MPQITTRLGAGLGGKFFFSTKAHIIIIIIKMMAKNKEWEG